MIEFQKAKIVGTNVAYAEYALEIFERGEPDFTMSRGALMEFANCPSRWRKGFGSKDTKATEWGQAIDTLLLSPERFEELIAVTPEKYPSAKEGEKDWNWNATFCKEWKADHREKLILKHADYGDARTALGALEHNRGVMELVRCSQRQVMVAGEYHDKETGVVVPVKALIDLVPDKNHPKHGKDLGDFKTCNNASPHAWRKAVFENDYDAQAALYTDLYIAATGEDRTDWLNPAQESFPPYESTDPIPALSSEFLDIGRMKCLHALRYYAKCVAENRWPSYGASERMQFDGRYIVQPDSWMMARVAEMTMPPTIGLPEIKPIETQLVDLTP